MKDDLRYRHTVEVTQTFSYIYEVDVDERQDQYAGGAGAQVLARGMFNAGQKPVREGRTVVDTRWIFAKRVPE